MIADNFLTMCCKRTLVPGLQVKLLLCTLLFQSLVLADSYNTQSGLQSLQSIRLSAEDYVRQLPELAAVKGIQVETGNLDPRLRLAQCNRSLEAFPPQGNYKLGNTAVGVRCSGQATWTVYVQVKVKAETDRVVLVNALPRGAIVGRRDIQLETRLQYLSTQTQAFVNGADAVVGMQTKRSLAPGTSLTVSMVQAPNIVQRGDRVTLVAGSGGLQVNMAGKALEKGAVGDRIRVSNLKSRREVEGLVHKDGSVWVSR